MVLVAFAWALMVIVSAAQESADTGIPSSVIVAFITAAATFGGAFLMFKGKTQDTANWLIVELRNEAKLARELALECEIARHTQAEKIELLEEKVRKLSRKIAAAEEEVFKCEDCSKMETK